MVSIDVHADIGTVTQWWRALCCGKLWNVETVLYVSDDDVVPGSPSFTAERLRA